MKIFFIFSLVMLLTYSVGYWLSKRGSENVKQSISYSSCDPSKKTCKVDNENNVYTINFNSQPSALVPFEVNVDVTDKQPQSIVVTFDMEGMDMGFNEYLLIKNASNWRAKVILPICSLGKKQWLLSVTFKFDNEINMTHFNFMQTHLK